MKRKKGREADSRAATTGLYWIIGLSLLAVFGAWVADMFAGRRPIPQAIPLGPLNLRIYSLCILLGVVAGYYLALWRRERYGLTKDQVQDLLFWGIIVGLLGARMGFVIQNLEYFLRNPLEIFGFVPGRGFIGIQGLSVHGSIVALVLFLIVYAPLKKIPWQNIGDLVAPSFLLGQAIGRWGNFFNQELYGYPTNVPWKLYVEPLHRVPGYEASEFFHPVFLYESLLTLLGVFLFLRLERRRPPPGSLMMLYFIYYGLVRFIVEIWRIEPRVLGPLSPAQLFSLLLMAAGFLGWLWVSRKR